MAINKDSNSYTFIFALIMCVVVGSILAVTAMSLKPLQDENIRKEKMQNILAAIEVKTDLNGAPALYKEHVKDEECVVLDQNGKVIEGVKAFDVDIQKQYREFKAKVRKAEDLQYPLYVCEKDGKTLYVIPMVGTGLWGPIWGYLSLQDDYNTVYGASFDHKTETPGLGAEIKTEAFCNHFKGEQILDGSGNYVSISVVKGGAPADDKHGVDAISGGTITSKGVEEMLKRTLKVYSDYFKTKQ